MKTTIHSSAKERLFDALYTLLETTPLSRIKVTHLVSLAQINRSTFYKTFESVPDLFQKAQQALCEKMRTVVLPQPQNKAELRRFSRVLADVFFSEHRDSIALLGGENGDLRTYWLLGVAFAERIRAQATLLGLEEDPDVLKNAEGAPGFIAAMFFYLINSKTLDQRWSKLPDDTYDVGKTFFENVAGCLQKMRGGSETFHYDLLLAYVHHYNDLLPRVSVTDLQQTAGISRTVFYQFYRSMEDFHDCYAQAMPDCAAGYVARVCRADVDAAVAMIRSFSEINYAFVQRSMRQAAVQGHLIVYLTLLIGSVMKQFGRTPYQVWYEQNEHDLKLLYYVGASISNVLMFYGGQMDEETLRAKLHMLDTIRAQLKLEAKTNA